MRKTSVLLVIVFLFGTLLSACESTEQRVRELMQLGERYLSEMKYEEALLIFEEVLEIDDTNVEAYSRLGEIYLAQEDYEASLQILSKGINTTQDPSLVKMQGEIQEQKRVVEEAIALQRAQEEEQEGYLEAIEKAAQTLPKAGSDDEFDWPDYLEDATTYVLDTRETLYLGEVNANGVPEGKGQGLIYFDTRVYYETGFEFVFLYVGQWKNGAPSGQGIAYCPWGRRFEGEWEAGLPNGEGIARSENRVATLSGNFTGGLADGTMAYTVSGGEVTFIMNCKNGVPQPMSDEGAYSYGAKDNCLEGYYVAKTRHEDGSAKAGFVGCPHQRYTWLGHGGSH